jgi:hypothetical protein
MTEPQEQPPRFSLTEILAEAVKGIRSEILLYGVVVIALLVGSASLGIEILRELKWPLIIFSTVILLAYFVWRAVPQARARLLQRARVTKRP